MERTPKVICITGFQLEAIRFFKDTGMSVARKAKQLSMPKQSGQLGAGDPISQAGRSRQVAAANERNGPQNRARKLPRNRSSCCNQPSILN